MSCGDKTSGSIAKCRPFSQATVKHLNPDSRFLSKILAPLNFSYKVSLVYGRNTFLAEPPDTQKYVRKGKRPKQEKRKKERKDQHDLNQQPKAGKVEVLSQLNKQTDFNWTHHLKNSHNS